jgi:hypothetical protein
MGNLKTKTDLKFVLVLHGSGTGYNCMEFSHNLLTHTFKVLLNFPLRRLTELVYGGENLVLQGQSAYKPSHII